MAVRKDIPQVKMAHFVNTEARSFGLDIFIACRMLVDLLRVGHSAYRRVHPVMAGVGSG